VEGAIETITNIVETVSGTSASDAQLLWVRYCPELLRHKRSKEIYHYRYVNLILLRVTQPALLLNCCELTLTRQSDGKVLFQNAFVTRHELTVKTVSEVVRASRNHSKTENKNNNVLTTKG
jgi:hypothetical protein